MPKSRKGARSLATWFTADTHFGHAGARALYRRPFPDVAAMDAALVERWNEAVAPADDVWHLGDFAVRQPAERVAALLDRLHGRKRLVTGNNDPPACRALNSSSFIPAAADSPDHKALMTFVSTALSI